MDKLTNTAAIAWIETMAKMFHDKKDFLTDLDRAIGDSDHGTNMERGFNAAAEKVKPLEGKDLGTIFKTVAMTLISTVGGASGPLFGSFFLQAATAVNGKNEADTNDVANMFEAGLKSIVSKGKAEVGDKTMVDALDPAVKALIESKDKPLTEAIQNAQIAARKGADSTKEIIAKKGRASYLGDRSIGNTDPGSESITIVLQALQDVISK